MTIIAKQQTEIPFYNQLNEFLWQQVTIIEKQPIEQGIIVIGQKTDISNLPTLKGSPGNSPV